MQLRSNYVSQLNIFYISHLNISIIFQYFYLLYILLSY